MMYGYRPVITPHYIIFPIPHLCHIVAGKEITRFNVTAVYICVLWSPFWNCNYYSSINAPADM